jgi:hypothetical protein
LAGLAVFLKQQSIYEEFIKCSVISRVTFNFIYQVIISFSGVDRECLSFFFITKVSEFIH